MMEEINERLLLLREKLKQSRKSVAQETEISEKTIANYESSRDPIGAEIRRLVKYYNTTFAYLIGEIDDPSPDALTKIKTLSDDDRKFLEKCYEAFLQAKEANIDVLAAMKDFQKEYDRMKGSE